VQKDKNCVYCGAKLPATSQLYKRKYCSASCGNKYKLRIKKPDVQAKIWQHEQNVFESTMELYWSGAESATIARRFDIPVGTVYSWIHDFGSQKQRKEPLKKLLSTAKSAEEWLCALWENTNYQDASFEDLTVSLVCGKHRGQSVDRLSSIIYESLKENLSSEKVYAFCNMGGNTITTIAWKPPIFNIAKYVKTSGTFLWPHENLGKSIEVTKAEFDCLLFLKKQEKVHEKVLKPLVLGGFCDIISS